MVVLGVGPSEYVTDKGDALSDIKWVCCHSAGRVLCLDFPLRESSLDTSNTRS